MNVTTSSTKILWTQVLGLAAVQGAIVLTWVIYNLYLDKLLGQFGFPVGLVTLILLIENGLAMVMEPLMGSYSDRAQYWLGSRFPFISVGVLLASGLLMAIAALAVWGNPDGLIRWLLPILLVAWAIAMTIFRSPALSLLSRYAYGSGLPQAASVLTVMGALAGSMGPLANQFILGLGPAIAFGMGTFALLGAATALRWVNPDLGRGGAKSSKAVLGTQPPLSFYNLALLFITGCGTSIGFRLQMVAFPKVLKTVPDINVGLTLGAVFLTLALTAIPAGKVASQLGNRKAMMIGLMGIAVTLGAMNAVQNTLMGIGVAIALGSCLSLVQNGTFPFVFSMVPAQKAGLGIGILFSGAALASNVVGVLLKQSDTLSPMMTIFLAIAGWLMALVAIASSRTSAPRQRPNI